MTDLLNKYLGVTFLSEPAWRWMVFVIAMSFFGAAWNGVLNFMK